MLPLKCPPSHPNNVLRMTDVTQLLTLALQLFTTNAHKYMIQMLNLVIFKTVGVTNENWTNKTSLSAFDSENVLDVNFKPSGDPVNN